MFTLGFFWDFQIAIAILWLFYRLLLCQKIRPSLERAYLLLIVPVALVFTAIDMPVLEPTTVIEHHIPTLSLVQSEIPTTQLMEKASVASPNLWELIYMSGVILLVLWGVVSMIRFASMVYHSEKIGGIYYTSHPISGCSFFSLIVVGKQYIDSPRLDDILFHERLHRDLLHSLDLTYIWFTSIILWFNPMAWLTMRSLRMVHEAQADRGVIANGCEPIRYIDTLLRAEAGFDYIPFNSLSYSLTKNRIKMITQKQPRHGALRLVMVLPLVGAMLFMFSFTSPTIVVSDAGTNFQSVVVTTNTNSTSFHTTTSGSDSVIVTSSIFKINSTDYAVILSKQKTTNGNEFFFTSRGISKEEFEKIDPFMIEKIEITSSKGNTPSNMISVTLREEPNKDAAISLMVGPDVQMGTLTNIHVSLKKMGATTITHTISTGPKTVAKKSSLDNVVITSYGQNGKSTSTTSRMIVGSYTSTDNTIQARGIDVEPDKEPLVMITRNGKTTEVPFAEFKKIDTRTIESFSILKDSSSAKVYGHKGKNGVILVEMKDQNEASASNEFGVHEVIMLYYDKTNNEPLVIVNWAGQKTPMETKYADFKKIKKDNIKSFSILKDSSAVAIYGEKGKNGVLIVELNKAPEKAAK